MMPDDVIQWAGLAIFAAVIVRIVAEIFQDKR